MEHPTWKRALADHASLVRWWRSSEGARAGGVQVLAQRRVEAAMVRLHEHLQAAGDGRADPGARVGDDIERFADLARSAPNEAGAGGLVPAYLDTAGSRAAAYDTAEALVSAVTWAITDEIVILLASAERTMPAEPVLATDLPSPSGFVWLETPFWLGDLPSADEPHPPRVPLRALHWSPTDHHDVEVVCYRGRDDVATHEDPMTDQERADLPLLWPCTQFSWNFGNPSHAGQQDDHSQVARFLKAMWTISAQTFVQAERPRLARADARRLDRANLSGGVVVVTLRRPQRSERESSSRPTEWSSRWLVRGHWRNQWLPSVAAHRLQWIGDHIKGPEDKPLVVSDKVIDFRR